MYIFDTISLFQLNVYEINILKYVIKIISLNSPFYGDSNLPKKY